MLEGDGGARLDRLHAELDRLQSELHRLDQSGLLTGLEHLDRNHVLRKLARLGSMAALLLAKTTAGLPDYELENLRHDCKLGFGEARDRVAVGRQYQQLPHTMAALASGEIGFGHVAQIAHAGAAITRGGGLFREINFVEAARRQSVNAFRYTCRELRISQDPEGALAEQKQIDDFRFLNLHNCEDGSVCLRGHFSQVDGQLIKTALEPLARKNGKQDHRDKDTRYADSLTELCGRALQAGDLPRVGGVRPHLMVTATLGTVLGVSSEPGRDLVSGEPVHPKTVERIACDCSVTRILMEGDSVVVDVGRARRVISPSQRKALCAQDPICRWQGCHRPAAYAYGHHVRFWRDGGGTDLGEMALLCGRHHYLVHEGGWHMFVDEDRRLITVPPPSGYGLPPPRAASPPAA